MFGVLNEDNVTAPPWCDVIVVRDVSLAECFHIQGRYIIKSIEQSPGVLSSQVRTITIDPSFFLIVITRHIVHHLIDDIRGLNLDSTNAPRLLYQNSWYVLLLSMRSLSFSLSLSLSFSLSLSLSVCVCVCLSLCLSLSVCLRERERERERESLHIFLNRDIGVAYMVTTKCPNDAETGIDLVAIAHQHDEYIAHDILITIYIYN